MNEELSGVVESIEKFVTRQVAAVEQEAYGHIENARKDGEQRAFERMRDWLEEQMDTPEEREQHTNPEV